MTSASLSLDDQLCFSLYRASRLVTRSYQHLLAELGITYPQYLVMLVLWETEEPTGMKELAARLDLDSGTLTPLTKRLIALGLVTKERDTQDERRAVLTLTPAGRELKTRADSVPERLYTLCTREGLDLNDLKTNLDSLADHLST